jgi:hypothetical protein
VARGTHLRQEPLAIPKGQVDPSDVKVYDLQLDARDALLVENRIFRTAVPNLSDRVSKVLMYRHTYCWMKRDVYLENPNAVRLAKADPITRRLLGGYRDVDTVPWALPDWADRHAVPQRTVPWTVTV